MLTSLFSLFYFTGVSVTGFCTDDEPNLFSLSLSRQSVFIQSRSQSPRAFWSAPRHGALEKSISRDQDFRTSGFTAHAWLGLNGV